MSAVSAPVIDRVRTMSVRRRAVLGLLGLLVISFFLRSTALHGRYWIDEGLSVGIAHHPITDIPGLLKQDGSPPLYYMLLGVWIRLIGDGEARTHALSLGFALLCVPSAWLLARAMFNERAAWFTAVIAALLPFLSYYAQETRMYSLVVLLSMLAGGAYAMAFIRGRSRWLWLFVVAGTLLVYTHNWGLFLLAGSGLALLPGLRAGLVRWRDAIIGYAAIAVLYLPWLPTVLYQAKHTGAPWSVAPNLFDLPGALAATVGGNGPGVALLLVGGSGLVGYWSLRERTTGPRSAEARIVLTLGGGLLLALALAFIASQISPGWTLRYFAALVGPLILVAGGVLSRADNMGLAAAALLAGLWLHPPTARVNNKSNVHHVSMLMRRVVEPGDLVVSTQPEQVPVMHFYFPPGLRWASGMGYFPDTGIMDWRDALEIYRNAATRSVAENFIDVLRPGQQLVLALPIIRSASWTAPWTSLVLTRSKQWVRVLDADRRLVRERAIPHLGNSRLPHGIRIVLYRKLAQPR